MSQTVSLGPLASGLGPVPGPNFLGSPMGIVMAYETNVNPTSAAAGASHYGTLIDAPTLYKVNIRPQFRRDVIHRLDDDHAPDSAAPAKLLPKLLEIIEHHSGLHVWSRNRIWSPRPINVALLHQQSANGLGPGVWMAAWSKRRSSSPMEWSLPRNPVNLWSNSETPNAAVAEVNGITAGS